MNSSTGALAVTGIVLICAHVGLHSARAAPVVWPKSSGGNGHAYEVVSAPLDWDTARAAAEARTHQSLPGHLAGISTSAENAFVWNLFTAQSASQTA